MSCFPHYRILLYLFGVILLSTTAYAQDSVKMQVLSGFDSIPMHDINAIGNPKTGAVDISMQLTNAYAKHWITLIFAGGAFGDFGVTDEKNVNYKIYSNDRLMSTGGINKGYGQIWNLELGKSIPKMIIQVQDTLQPGASTTLQFRLGHVNTSVKKLTDMHLLSIVYLEYMHSGQKPYYVRNLPIHWQNVGN